MDTGEEIPATNIYVYSNMIYGHVHIAKTGGTTINGILANGFEGVCGNKENSYNAYVVNEELKKKAKKGKSNKWVQREPDRNYEQKKEMKNGNTGEAGNALPEFSSERRPQRYLPQTDGRFPAVY